MNKNTRYEQQSTGSVSVLRWQVTLTGLTMLLLGTVDGALGVLIPSLRGHYQLDTTSIGQIFLFDSIGYLFTALSNGLLVERLGQRTVLLSGVLAFFVSVALISLMPPFGVVLLLMLVQASGAATIHVGFSAFLARMSQRTTLLNYLHAASGLGAFFGPLLATVVIASQLGWHCVYLAWAVLSLLIFAALPMIFKGNADLSSLEDGRRADNVLRLALRTPIVLLVAGFFLLFVGVEFSLGNWSYSFLTGQLHGPPVLMGWAVSGYWLGEVAGRLTLARYAQQIGEQQMVLLCLLGSMVGLLCIWLAPQVAAAGLCLTGFCLGPISATTMAFLARHVPPRLLPSAIGFLLCFGTIGSALFSWLAGGLAHISGFGSLLLYEIILTATLICYWLLLSARTR